jgi:hypothetical protein
MTKKRKPAAGGRTVRPLVVAAIVTGLILALSTATGRSLLAAFARGAHAIYP